MRRHGYFTAAMLALGSLAGGTAGAQPTAPAGPPGWQFSVTPYAWLPALGGTLSTPSPRIGDPGLTLGSGTVLTSLDAVPVMLAGEARYGRFAVLGDLFHAALRQDVTTRDLLAGSGHARITSTVGTLLGMVRVIEAPRQGLELGAGTRIWGFDEKVSLAPGAIGAGTIRRASQSWADPLLALRYTAMISPRAGVTLYADIGGFGAGSELTWQMVGSVDYIVTDSTTIRGGWRYLALDRAGRAGTSLDLTFNGPFLAATFRF